MPATAATLETRTRLLAAAERLFAEHGPGVSNRQIGEAAGQANNSVVGYHFGTKGDLVLAVLRHHAPDIERRRLERLSKARPRALAGWLDVTLQPIADHLEALGTPSWFARFLAQMATDPALREVALAETLAAPSMREASAGLLGSLPKLPPRVLTERSNMMRDLIVHTFAERERALAAGAPTPRASWTDAAQGLAEALVGLWRAPSKGTR